MIDKRDAIVAELPRLRRYARALLRDPAAADDLVQDCVERALSRLAQFRAGTNMRSWLFAIMHSVYVNSVRRASRRPHDRSVDSALAEDIAVPAAQDGRLGARDMAAALERLSDEQREVVLLVGLEELSYREAADVLAVPIGTVMSRLARGREQLRRLMEGAPPATVRRVR